MHWGVTILPLNAIVSQRACNSPSLHVLYLGSKIVKNIFYYFWLDVQIYRGHTLTLSSALGWGGGGHYTTIKCNCFLRACNSPSFHVLYLCPKIIKNLFCYFWLDVQIYRGHPLTLISAMGGHYTAIKCNCFPACMQLSQFACTLFRSKNRQHYILIFLVGCPNI